MREEVADFFRIHCQQITGQRANVTSQKKLAALQHVQKKKKTRRVAAAASKHHEVVATM